MRKRVLQTLGTLILGQGTAIVAGVVTARAFGPAGKSVMSLAVYTIAFAFTTADGLRSAIAYQAGTLGRELGTVWNTALRVIAVASAVGTATLLVLAHAQPERPAFYYAAIAFAVALFGQTAGMVYQLRDRAEEINLTNTLTIGGGNSLVTLVAVLVFHAPLTFVMYLWSASYAAMALFAAINMRGFGLRTHAYAPAREQLWFAAKASLLANAAFLALRIDVFVVTIMLPPAALGVYGVGLAAGEVMMTVSRALLWSAQGRIAALDAGEAAALTARTVRMVIAASAAGAIALFAVAPALIDFVYGRAFADAGNVVRLLLPGIVFYSADGLLTYYISVRSARPGLLLAIESVTVLGCATVSVAGVARYGIAGAAFANSVAYVLAFGIKVFVFSRFSGVPVARAVIVRGDDVRGLFRVRGSG